MNTYLNINMYYLNVHVFKYVYVLIHTHRHFVFLFFLEIIMFFFFCYYSPSLCPQTFSSFRLYFYFYPIFNYINFSPETPPQGPSSTPVQIVALHPSAQRSLWAFPSRCGWTVPFLCFFFFFFKSYLLGFNFI